jgi:FdhE protein
VAAAFLRNFLGRSAPPLPAEVQAAVEELVQLGRQRPSLAEPAALLADLLPALYEEPPRDPLPVIPPEHATAKLTGGVPLLRGERISLDGAAWGKRWQRVCTVLRRHRQGNAPQALTEMVRRGRLDLVDLVGELLAGRPEAVHARAAELELDAGLTASVLRFTAMPALARLNAGLESLLGGAPWEAGSCPTCGSGPLLGEYRGLEQTRFLRCGFCTAEWPFPRLQCPYCATRDHRVLGYFGVEGEEEKYRAATCETCRGSVKMVSTLGALSGPQLVVADLATVHLDLAAAERGYGASPS